MQPAWPRPSLNLGIHASCYRATGFTSLLSTFAVGQSVRSLSSTSPSSAESSSSEQPASLTSSSSSSTTLSHLRDIVNGSPTVPSLKSDLKGVLRAPTVLNRLRRRRTRAQRRDALAAAAHKSSRGSDTTTATATAAALLTSSNFVSLSDPIDNGGVTNPAKQQTAPTPRVWYSSSRQAATTTATNSTRAPGPRLLRYQSHGLAGSRFQSSRFPVAGMASQQRIEKPILFVCDVQEKFRTAIWEFSKVVATTQKMVKAASILKIPIFLTTQNAARLGATVDEVSSLLPTQPIDAIEIDKTAFSMLVPDLQRALEPYTFGSNSNQRTPLSVILVGIETHICVTQTALDLLRGGHKVYILADGVSSCNEAERPVALARLAREGAVVTTSESLLFELLGDAKSEHFRAVSGLIKDSKDSTKAAVTTLGKL